MKRHRTVLAGALAVLLVAQTASFATTRTVTNLNDSGSGSLRGTIAVAGSGDTINFSVTGTIQLTSDELLINKNLTIAGPGARVLTVAGGGSNTNLRVLHIANGTHTGPVVSISGLTISNGYVLGSGGGIANEYGALTLTDCAITGNTADGGSGGGVFNNASVSGAATLSASGCTFASNTSKFNAGARSGGDGGAIFSDGNTQTSGVHADVFLWNCTLYNNSVSGASFVGAAAISSLDTNLNLNSCTVAYNHGGPSVISDNLTIGNTIVVTRPPDPTFMGSPGTITDNGYNLCFGGDPSSPGGCDALAAASHAGNGDRFAQDPKLDSTGLNDNGGPTQTIALIFGSPVIDQGNSFGLTMDQRGFTRPVSHPNVTCAADCSDIGAYEAGSDPIQDPGGTLTVNNAQDHNDGVCGGYDCTLREALQVAGGRGSGTIAFASNVTGTIILTQGPLALNGNITILGPGSSIAAPLLLALSGNQLQPIFTAAAGTTSYVSRLTIRDGWNTGNTGDGVSRQGGAIYNGATLTFSDCTFSNNFVAGANDTGNGGNGGAGLGGAIYNVGTLTLDSCTFGFATAGNIRLPGNSAAGGGGGANSLPLGHGGAGGAGQGGAIFNDTAGTLTITNCTFDNNSAIGGAGGNGHFGGFGGDGDGGAIFNQGTMTVTSATISGNSGTGGAGGAGSNSINHGGPGKGKGGGVAVNGGSSIVANTIVAGNGGANGGGIDVDGAFNSSGFNLIGTADHSTGFTATGDQTGTDAMMINARLGFQANYGGPIETIPLLYQSPALDAGKNFTSFGNDQRVQARTVDIPIYPNANGGDGTDIGAVEMNLVNGPDLNNNGMAADFEIFYGVTNPNADPDGDGMSNLQEFLAGTNPLDPTSNLRIIAVAKNGSNFPVTFSLAVVGKVYRLERKDALTDSTWNSISGLSDFSPASTGSAQITDTGGASTTKRFYRIEVLQ